MDTINSKKSTDKSAAKMCENRRDRTTVEHPLKRPKCTDRKVYSTLPAPNLGTNSEQITKTTKEYLKASV